MQVQPGRHALLGRGCQQLLQVPWDWPGACIIELMQGSNKPPVIRRCCYLNRQEGRWISLCKLHVQV